MAKTPRCAQLARPTFLYPQNKRWIGIAQDAGAVVVVRGAPEVGPSGLEEVPVTALDNIGREYDAWIPKTTDLKDAPRGIKTPLFVSLPADTKLGPLDQLRSEVALHRLRDPEIPWTIRNWCCTFGNDHQDLLRAVVRELGGRVPEDADAPTVIRRALRLMLNEEIPMSEVAEGQAAKKGAKSASATATKGKTAAKKTTAKSAVTAPARSMSRTAGTAALSALEKAGAPGAIKALAKKLAGDQQLGKKDLTTLRDGINAAADKAREEKKPAVAAALSSANRLIRRLARKA